MRVKGVCPHDCPDTCSWIVEVKDGRAVNISGDPDHPITRGVLCAKVKRYLERTYHPERVLYPLKRSGRKGEGIFQPVSWDDALEEISEKLNQIIARHGSESILPYSYSGTLGLIQGSSMDRRFTHILGATLLERSLCSDAGVSGYSYTIGSTIGTPPEDFQFAKFIILWGTNTLTSNLHLWKFILKAKRRGADVVVIDPIKTKTARNADMWIPIRPGSDGALALSIMNVLVSERLYDREYVEKYTVGFSELKKRVEEWPPERAEKVTDIPAETIRRMARKYARLQPSVIRVNYGMQRNRGGGNAIRAISMLPALVGAWRFRGGGILLSTSGAFTWNKFALERPDLMPGNVRKVNATRLGDALSPRVEDRERAVIYGSPEIPIKALIVYNSNPAVTAPDSNSVVNGLKRDDLFTVVIDHFVTDTASYADFILPATTQLEHWDLHTSYGHYFISLNRPAIEPVGESKPNTWIFKNLAIKMGFDHPVFHDSDIELIKQALSVKNPWMEGISFEKLLKSGFARLNVPETLFKEGNFPTESGKCEFYSERALKDGYSPMPEYIPPYEVPAPGGDKLAFLSPSAHFYLNSNYANVESLMRLQGEPVLFLHPKDAIPRGIRDGDTVRVWNMRGSITLKARITRDIKPGVCAAYGIWWRMNSRDGQSVNSLTSMKETDMAGGATYFDVEVEVERVND